MLEDILWEDILWEDILLKGILLKDSLLKDSLLKDSLWKDSLLKDSLLKYILFRIFKKINFCYFIFYKIYLVKYCLLNTFCKIVIKDASEKYILLNNT